APIPLLITDRAQRHRLRCLPGSSPDPWRTMVPCKRWGGLVSPPHLLVSFGPSRLERAVRDRDVGDRLPVLRRGLPGQCAVVVDDRDVVTAAVERVECCPKIQDQGLVLVGGHGCD